VVNQARARREAIRQLAEVRRRLEAAECALADALAEMKAAEARFDAINDRFGELEHALARRVLGGTRRGGTVRSPAG
jgi:chromosome segregation ATPase